MSPRYKIDPDMVDDDRYRFTPGLGRTRTGPRGHDYWESRDRHNSASTASNQPGLDPYRPSTSSFEHRQYESHRPYQHIGTEHDPFRSGFPSSQERVESARRLRGNKGSDRAPSSQKSGEREQVPGRSTPNSYDTNNNPLRSSTERATDDADLSDFRSHTQLLNQLFAEAQRNRSRDEASSDDLFGWGDSRRSDEHLPGREVVDSRIKIKQEPVEEMFSVTNNRSVYGNNRRAGRDPHRRPIKPEHEAEVAMSFRNANNMRSSPESSGYDAGSSNESSRGSDDTRDNTPPQFPVPPMPRPNIPGACMCPINKECPARGDHLIDCRTLVIEWKRWNARQGEGDIEVIPEDVDPDHEPLVDVREAAHIVHLINEVNRLPAAGGAIRYTYNLIRFWSEMMATNSITENDLHASNALPTIQAFLSEDNAPRRAAKRVPIRIVEDLTVLMRKWEIGDFGQLPRRGLIRQHVDPEWPFRRNARFFGNGHLVNGQKWNSRAAMARDGAHGPLQAGISGSKHTGAYSVVMGYHDTYKHDFYADIDCGNRIWYLGTALKPPETDELGNYVAMEPTNIRDPVDANLNPDPEFATHGAQALMKSNETGEPVRVFRAFKAAKICAHRPKKGFRYDGLYQIVDFECLKVDRQIYRFEMVRLDDGQGPIRSGVPAEPISGRERQEMRTMARRARRGRERADGRGRRR